MEVFDYLDGAANQCGVYSLEMYVDDELSYSHIMDEFSFSETRYVNAHIDYKERVRSGTKAHRLHRLPNDRLSIYKPKTGSKPLQIDELRSYPIRIVATDVAGNSSVLEFRLQGTELKMAEPAAKKGDFMRMKYNQANSFNEGPVELEIPLNALYQDLDFTFQSSPPVPAPLRPFTRSPAARCLYMCLLP